MNVQIFISEENKELIYDNDQLSEFTALVSELGLKCDNHIDKQKSPIPFLWIDEATVRAFNILCPSVDEITKYNLEIPLEILRNVKLSETEKYFDWVEVWSNKKDPDTFCIGRVYKDEDARSKGYKWNAHYYLIGRWGAENKTVPELIRDAIKIASGRVKSAAATTIARMTSWNACPDEWARQYIFNNNGEVSSVVKSGGNDFVDLPF